MQFHEDGNRSFVESPAGTMCFTTTIVPSPDYAARHPPDSDDDMYGGQAADIFSDVVVRSHDQGRTWGDLTQICPKDNPHESNLAVDPQNDRHLFAMTRCQRGLTTGESETVRLQSVVSVTDLREVLLPTGVRSVRQPRSHGRQARRALRVVGRWSELGPTRHVSVLRAPWQRDVCAIRCRGCDAQRRWIHGRRGRARRAQSPTTFCIQSLPSFPQCQLGTGCAREFDRRCVFP